MSESGESSNSAGQDIAERNAAYWRKNLATLASLLVIWFLCSFGFGILFVDQLNQFEFLGVKLGFWFAQQGAIYIFVVLIFIYTARMRVIDRQFGVDDTDEPDSYDEIPQSGPGAAS